MRLQLAGFEKAITISNKVVTVIEIHNKTLFSRVCRSLLSGESEKAIEPYLLWDDSGNELNSLAALKIVGDPLNLPWIDKDLGGKVYERFEALFYEEDASRREIEGLYRSLQTKITNLGLQMQSSYSFALEWEMKKFLKAFNFAVDVDAEGPLLDNIIRFLELLVDVEFNKPVAFINLKSFFSENDLMILYEQAVFSGKSMVLLESTPDLRFFESEMKYIIDQELIQMEKKKLVRGSSLCSGEFDPMVLEQ